MKRALTAFFVLLALVGAAHAFGLGLGNRFGKLGSFGSGSIGPPPVSCASTGIFDLSNVCNDIYLLTGSL